MVGIFNSSVFNNAIFNTGVVAVRTNTLGGGKKQLAYHSMNDYYENELIKKLEREEKEKKKELAALEKKKVKIEEKIAVVEVAKELPKFDVKKYERQANQLQKLLIQIEEINVFLAEAQKIKEKRRKNMLLLVIMMANPLMNMRMQ